MKETIKFGRINGQIELSSQPQTIEGYDLEFTTWQFCNLPSTVLDGATVTLKSGTTPPQLIEEGIFYELLKSGHAELKETRPDGTIIIHQPQPNDNSPIIIDAHSQIQWRNIGSKPVVFDEMTLPGFEKCVLKNL